MRRRAAAVLALTLLLTAFTPPAEARQALFGPDSGFHQARFGNRESIRIQDLKWLRFGVRYWNARAGWELLMRTDTDPQITGHRRFQTLHGHCDACAMLFEPENQWQQPYERCGVAVHPNYGRDEDTVIHEVGHCLGLRHQRRGVMSPKGFNVKVDRRLLVEAGYRS